MNRVLWFCCSLSSRSRRAVRSRKPLVVTRCRRVPSLSSAQSYCIVPPGREDFSRCTLPSRPVPPRKLSSLSLTVPFHRQNLPRPVQDTLLTVVSSHPFPTRLHEKNEIQTTKLASSARRWSHSSITFKGTVVTKLPAFYVRACCAHAAVWGTPVFTYTHPRAPCGGEEKL